VLLLLFSPLDANKRDLHDKYPHRVTAENVPSTVVRAMELATTRRPDAARFLSILSILSARSRSIRSAVPIRRRDQHERLGVRKSFNPGEIALSRAKERIVDPRPIAPTVIWRFADLVDPFRGGSTLVDYTRIILQ
jgi:hypothetical protein